MIVLVEAVLAAKSGIGRDAVINTFVVQTNTVVPWDPSTDLGEVTIPIAQFYTWSGPGGNELGKYLSNELSRTAEGVTLNVYDITTHLDGSPHGTPIAVDHATLPTALGGADLPGEVAAVLTTRAFGWTEQVVEQADADDPADAKRDRPKQRYSGRVYVGPLNMNAVATDTAPLYISRPSAAFIDALFVAGAQVQQGLAAAGHEWSVWSRKDATVREIGYLQVDNAWDTQRRRGTRPTERVTLLASDIAIS